VTQAAGSEAIVTQAAGSEAVEQCEVRGGGGGGAGAVVALRVRGCGRFGAYCTRRRWSSATTTTRGCVHQIHRDRDGGDRDAGRPLRGDRDGV